MPAKERLEIGLFRAGYALVFAFMLLPLVVVVSSSFTTSGTLVFPPEGFTLQWYGEFLEDFRWLQAVENSLIVATGTTVLSSVLGIGAAFGLRELDSTLIAYLTPLVLAPLLIPPVVLGIALLIFLSRFGVHQTYLSLVVAHSLWATPLVFFIMQSVFARFDWQLRDAGQDLGASPSRNFVHVILPGVKNGIIVSAIIAFIISLQEFVMALFLSGNDTQTIPVLAWSTLRQSLDPMVSVVSTFLILASIVGILIAVVLMNIEWLGRQLS